MQFLGAVSYFLPQSIYGGKFADEKAGFKSRIFKGTIAMANSGKNSNSSQFFLVLTEDPIAHKKIAGKYVCFGKVVEGIEVLEILNDHGTVSGVPSEKIWIKGGGRCP